MCFFQAFSPRSVSSSLTAIALVVLTLTTVVDNADAKQVCGQEVVLKDTYSDSDLWSGANFISESITLYSNTSSAPDEYRVYIGFQGAGTLDKISFPVFFHNNGVPVPDPSAVPYRLSVKIHQDLGELASNPLLVDTLLDAPSNMDWRETAFVQDGQTLFHQVWDLSSLNAHVGSGVHYMTINAIAPNGNFEEAPNIPLVIGAGNSIGSENDYFFIEGVLTEPMPINIIFPGSQAAVKVTVLDPSGSSLDVTPDSYNALRGVYRDGDISDVQESNDSYLRFNPGFTLNSSEAPVWLEFTGEVPQCAINSVQSLDLTLESGADTPGLEYRLELFNYTLGTYETIDAFAEGFGDTVVEQPIVGADDYFDPTTGEMKLRMGWRRVGFTILFPHTVSIDQVKWDVGTQ